jgi:hypothetical protein
MKEKTIPRNEDWAKYLVYGSRTRVAKKHKTSPSLVNAVLVGRIKNEEIINSLMEEALKEKKRREIIEAKKNDLINQLQ